MKLTRIIPVKIDYMKLASVPAIDLHFPDDLNVCKQPHTLLTEYYTVLKLACKDKFI